MKLTHRQSIGIYWQVHAFGIPLTTDENGGACRRNHIIVTQLKSREVAKKHGIRNLYDRDKQFCPRFWSGMELNHFPIPVLFD